MIAYIDIISGISGDMFLGALIDAGYPANQLEKELRKLPIDFEIEIKKERDVVEGTSIYIYSKDKNKRGLKDIFSIIDNSNIDKDVKEKAKNIFRKIAEVEAKIHGIDIQDVHFHELGGIDTIIDVIGSLIALKGLRIEKIYSSPVKVGRGIIECSHGKLPVPAPATLELLRGKPIEFSNIATEITTPTGAALLSLAEFSYPEMEVKKIGYGMGKKKLGMPNLLRIVIGNEIDKEGIYIVETNIDDMNPEFYPHIIDILLEAGATDAFIVPVIMKKGRMGVMLKALTTKEKMEKIKRVIFKETTTFGLRYYKVVRDKIERRSLIVETGYGKVKVKIGYFNGKAVNISPEYEDCRKIAKEKGISLKEIYEEAKEKAKKRLTSSSF